MYFYRLLDTHSDRVTGNAFRLSMAEPTKDEFCDKIPGINFSYPISYPKANWISNRRVSPNICPLKLIEK